MEFLQNIEENAPKLINADEREEAKKILKSKQTLHEMVHYYKDKVRPPKFETGLTQLDMHFNGGLEVGQLIGVGGAPEAGKSTTLERIINNVSAGFKVLYYTLEFSPRDYAEKYMKTVAEKHKNIIVDPETYFIDEIERDVTLLSKHEDCKFVVLDSQMKLAHKELTGFDATNDIFRRLKNLARINEIIIFVIVQSSKGDHASGGKGVYGSILAEHELNQYWFLTSDKQEKTTTIEFKKNKQNGNYANVTVGWEDRSIPTYTQDYNADTPSSIRMAG